MLPSSTVENYLKAIYQGQSSLARDERLVSMGHVAAALGVTPGTATTMVKALAESGLAEYEPYSGVRLTAAGEKLAGLVLRRYVRLEYEGPHADVYSRRLAYVILEDGTDVNEVLVREGLARISARLQKSRPRSWTAPRLSPGGPSSWRIHSKIWAQ